MKGLGCMKTVPTLSNEDAYTPTQLGLAFKPLFYQYSIHEQPGLGPASSTEIHKKRMRVNRNTGRRGHLPLVPSPMVRSFAV